MKTKSLIFILVFSIITLLLVIFSSEIFTVKNIYINCLDNNNNLNLDIPNTFYGKNIFITDKVNLKFEIQKKYPTYRVIDIVSIFPNALKINIVSQQKTFAIKSNDYYYICDDCFSSIIDISTNNQNCIIVEGVNIKNGVVGCSLPINEKELNLLTKLAISIYQWIPVESLNKIYLINVNFSNKTLTLSMINQWIIYIENILNNLDKKLHYSISYYVNNFDNSPSVIKIIEDENIKMIIKKIG